MCAHYANLKGKIVIKLQKKFFFRVRGQMRSHNYILYPTHIGQEVILNLSFVF